MLCHSILSEHVRSIVERGKWIQLDQNQRVQILMRTFYFE